MQSLPNCASGRTLITMECLNLPNFTRYNRWDSTRSIVIIDELGGETRMETFSVIEPRSKILTMRRLAAGRGTYSWLLNLDCRALSLFPKTCSCCLLWKLRDTCPEIGRASCRERV